MPQARWMRDKNASSLLPYPSRACGPGSDVTTMVSTSNHLQEFRRSHRGFHQDDGNAGRYRHSPYPGKKAPLCQLSHSGCWDSRDLPHGNMVSLSSENHGSPWLLFSRGFQPSPTVAAEAVVPCGGTPTGEADGDTAGGCCGDRAVLVLPRTGRGGIWPEGPSCSPPKEKEERECLCAVCGDRASGNFFGATVCLPCKVSFFSACVGCF